MTTGIRTLLIDDEPKSLAILENKISRFCPELVIVDSIQSPDAALTIIEQEKPQLVFLDVTMPLMSGFELLSRVKSPSFEVIFATAFDNYAIEAINACAIGYLTKPINTDKLTRAVKKAILNIEEKTANQKNLAFIENLLNDLSKQKIAIPSSDGYDFIYAEELIRCEGIGGYTKLHFSTRSSLVSSYSIGYFKQLLTNKKFFMTHKSHLINLTHVTKFFNNGSIELTDNHIVPLSKKRKYDFLDYFNS